MASSSCQSGSSKDVVSGWTKGQQLQLAGKTRSFPLAIANESGNHNAIRERGTYPELLQSLGMVAEVSSLVVSTPVRRNCALDDRENSIACFKTAGAHLSLQRQRMHACVVWKRQRLRGRCWEGCPNHLYCIFKSGTNVASIVEKDINRLHALSCRAAVAWIAGVLGDDGAFVLKSDLQF